MRRSCRRQSDGGNRSKVFTFTGQKKRYPEGYLFTQLSLAISCRGRSRGRYFNGRVVPSAVEPQRQPLGPVPMLPPADGLVATAGALLISGVSVTVWPSTSVLNPCCDQYADLAIGIGLDLVDVLR